MELDQWLGLEVRHLAALQAVAEEGTFRGAATRLGYTQSAISQQIATLERIIGAKLLERPGGPRAVSLTPAGELVLRHAEAVVARLKAAQADVAAMVEGGSGSLRVGTFQSTGARLLPELMRRFRDDWPDIQVVLTESASDDELLASVERGDLDLSFVMPPVPEGPFSVLELLADPWVLLVRADSELAGRDAPVHLREAAQLPLIGSRTCRSREQVNAVFQTRGLAPNYVFHSDENNTVHGMVAAGAGVALIPRLAHDPNDARVVALELGPRVPPRTIGLAWHRDRYRPPCAVAFAQLAQELCAELASDLSPEPATA